MRCLTLLCAFVPAAHLGAQSLASRTSAADGRVQVEFPSRAGVCGDERGGIRNLLSRGNDDAANGDIRDRDVCIHGPARVVATVVHGEVTRLRTYVGATPPGGGDITDLGAVAPAQAREWLSALAERGATPVARDALVPLLVADGTIDWPELMKIARDDDRPGEVRRQAIFWLAQGASARIDPNGGGDDDIASAAVFAISQQPRAFAVPALIDAATTGKTPHARAAAMFWLGQTGDARGLSVFAKALDIGR